MRDTRETEIPSTASWLNGAWIQTASGGKFYPLAPRADDIDIVDIAESLSRQHRFAGHVRCDVEFYSVAEHCVLLAQHFTARGEYGHARYALLHDASEAYLVDVPRPIKQIMPVYREAEKRLMAVICEKFGLPRDEPYAVKDADTRILIDERAQLLAPPPAPWENEVAPLGVTVMGWPPRMAKAEFLRAFYWLFGGP